MTTSCNACGHPLADRAVVCLSCGTAIDPDSPFGPSPPQIIPPVDASLPRISNFAPMFAFTNDLEGIGGWLILVAIGLAVGPFFRIHGVNTDLRFLFTDRYQAALHTRPGMQVLFFYELVSNSFFLILYLLLNVLFYAKRRIFPSFMIFNLAAAFVVLLIDHIWATHYSPRTTWLHVIQSLIPACIWIPYFFASSRVKQTFVR
jgi:Protein of unknown function (DUF2569)